MRHLISLATPRPARHLAHNVLPPVPCSKVDPVASLRTDQVAVGPSRQGAASCSAPSASPQAPGAGPGAGILDTQAPPRRGVGASRLGRGSGGGYGGCCSGSHRSEERSPKIRASKHLHARQQRAPVNPYTRAARLLPRYQPARVNVYSRLTRPMREALVRASARLGRASTIGKGGPALHKGNAAALPSPAARPLGRPAPGAGAAGCTQ